MRQLRQSSWCQVSCLFAEKSDADWNGFEWSDPKARHPGAELYPIIGVPVCTHDFNANKEAVRSEKILGKVVN